MSKNFQSFFLSESSGSSPTVRFLSYFLSFRLSLLYFLVFSYHIFSAFIWNAQRTKWDPKPNSIKRQKRHQTQTETQNRNQNQNHERKKRKNWHFRNFFKWTFCIVLLSSLSLFFFKKRMKKVSFNHHNL